MSLRLTLRRMLDATKIPLQNGLHYRENFDVLRKVASGVPWKTTPNQDAMFLQAVRAKPFTSLQELKDICFKYVAGDINYYVSVFVIIFDVCYLRVLRSLISRRLNERGIYGRVPVVKEFLSVVCFDSYV